MERSPDGFEMLSPSQVQERNEGAVEDSLELLVLDSMLPVVRHLSGLTLVSDESSRHYYIHGQISNHDWKSFCDYAKRVGELSLSATCGAKDASQLAPQAFACLAQFQDPGVTLFPSLRRLRISGVSTALDFLHLFISSSLATLEIADIPVSGPQYSSILSFLASAFDQAPHIKSISLGPGQIPNKILNTCLKYRCLHRLELRNAKFLMTYQVLKSIGSLEHLESFSLRFPENSGYLPSNSIQPNAQKLAPLVSQKAKQGVATTRRSPSPSEWSRCTSPEPTPRAPPEKAVDRSKEESRIMENFLENNADTGSRELFAMLKELTVAGCPELVKDLINSVSSPDVRRLSVTFRAAAKPPAQPACPVGPANVKTTKIKGSPFSTEKVVPTPPKEPEDVPIIPLIEQSVQKWATTLVSVSFCGDRTPPSISFPSDVFESLLLRPETEALEVTDFDLNTIDDSLRRLKEVTTSKLKVLRLPFHTSTPGISLSRLRHVALCCPQLISFRCRFKHLSNVPPYDMPDPLSHQLQVLSVANAEPHPDPQRLLHIAGYLDMLFPNLRMIESHPGMGYNGDQWSTVLDLVKLCQAVRLVDKYRLEKVNVDGLSFES